MILGNTLTNLDEYARAIDALTEARQLFVQLEQAGDAAWCLTSIGIAQVWLNDCTAAERSFAQASAESTILGDEFITARCRQFQGHLCMDRDDYQTAIQHLAAARTTFIALGANFELAQCTLFLGDLRLALGDFNAAQTDFEAASEEYRKLGATNGQTTSWLYLGIVHRKRQDFKRAEELIGSARDVFSQVADRLALAHCALQFAYLRQDQNRLEAAILEFTTARTMFASIRNHKSVECEMRIAELQARLAVPVRGAR